ncbi:diguanylate cyclase [Desulfofundulus kuznetsovii DSM 6115]|uniref:Diguanylate cyclase n=1 Tax=Desulfofundulus kuznetsovii (strain DSM 6115 / VKM B-1805 / 17) TaxID=760568 RepID=A0AAU8PJH5_DESK7|nr:diguanylate cyclase [Desulfofundulus kuznetsovii DSM 6115]
MQTAPTNRGGFHFYREVINIAGKGEFFEECQREVDCPLNSPKGCLLVLHNLKGGAGKTIIAMNLAALLAKAGYKTCLADLDLETAGATNYLFNGSKPPVSIVSWADFPWQQKHDPETVKAFLAQGPAGMWVVPAPAFVYQEKLITDSVAENVLDCLLFHFDYVIVDLGGSLCPSVRAALQMADVVFLPVTPDEMAISAAVRFATQVVGDGKLLSSDKVRLIVNRYRTRAPRRPVDVARQVNLDLAFVLPDDIPAVDAASRSRDRLVVLVRKKTPLKEGFYSLAESLVPGYGSGIKPVPDEAAVGEVAVQGVPGESRREKKDITGLVHTILRFLGKSRTCEATVKPCNASCDSEGQIEEAQFQTGRREEELDRKEIDEECEENACSEGRCELPSSVSESKEDVPDAFYRDALTGCFTRRYLLERFSPTGFYTVVFIDLDNFKPVNDILGHEMGDGVLAAFGKMLVENLKGRDLAVRWGGDEFLLVLPGTARADAEKVVENLRREWRYCAPDTGNLEVGFSAGIVEGARDLQATIKEADRLMYAEKKSRKAKEAWEKSHPRELYTPPATRFARVDWATLKQAASLAFSITAVVVLVSAVVWGMDWTAQMFGAHAPVLHEAARVVEEFWKTVLAGVFG